MYSVPDAKIVSSRLQSHYDPQLLLDFVTHNDTEAATTSGELRQAFQPTHERMKQLMYFC
jgi:hypothetical protein